MKPKETEVSPRECMACGPNFIGICPHRTASQPSDLERLENAVRAFLEAADNVRLMVHGGAGDFNRFNDAMTSLREAIGPLDGSSK